VRFPAPRSVSGAAEGAWCGSRRPGGGAMSLSRLEKDQVEAESARVELLKAKALSKEVDERKLRRKVAEEEREHTRYSYKGARQAATARVANAHVSAAAAPPLRPAPR